MTDLFDSVRRSSNSSERFGAAHVQYAYTARSAPMEFSSDEFLESFLNPVERGCAAHDDINCLCDVDTSLTAGMVFDKVPNELVNVETHEDLVRGAANIWLNYDVRPREHLPCDWTDDPVRIRQVADMVKGGRERKAIMKELDLFIDDHVFSMMRDAANVSMRPKVPMDLVKELHAEGLSLSQIADRIKAIEGHRFLNSTISYALKRLGLKPHWSYVQGVGGRGCPRGYKVGSGLSYREWRERYGDDA